MVNPLEEGGEEEQRRIPTVRAMLFREEQRRLDEVDVAAAVGEPDGGGRAETDLMQELEAATAALRLDGGRGSGSEGENQNVESDTDDSAESRTSSTRGSRGDSVDASTEESSGAGSDRGEDWFDSAEDSGHGDSFASGGFDRGVYYRDPSVPPYSQIVPDRGDWSAFNGMEPPPRYEEFLYSSDVYGGDFNFSPPAQLQSPMDFRYPTTALSTPLSSPERSVFQYPPPGVVYQSMAVLCPTFTPVLAECYAPPQPSAPVMSMPQATTAPASPQTPGSAANVLGYWSREEGYHRFGTAGFNNVILDCKTGFFQNGQELSYVMNMWEPGLVEAVSQLPPYPDYYVPPKVDDDDYFGGQLRMWQIKMVEHFGKFYPHVWKMQGVPAFQRDINEGWLGFTVTSKLRFCCRQCETPWTSKQGRICCAFQLDHTSQFGCILMKIFGQVCMRQDCTDWTYQTPAAYPEEIDRAMMKLADFIGFTYYGMYTDTPSLFEECRKSIRVSCPQNRRGRALQDRHYHHRTELCQACSQGICQESNLGLLCA